MTKDIYCTYLTVYHGDKLPPLYIGSTSVNRINKGYRGSVKSKKYEQIWKSELKENPHLFETRILTTHETREEAFNEEVRYQIEHDVVRSQQYINMAVANEKYIFVDYDDPERNRKISESTKKCWEDTEYRKKLSEAHKKRYENPEERKKLSEYNRGKKRSEETKKKISEAAKKRYENPEERKKSSVAQKSRNYSHSEENKKKISEIHKGKNKSEEHKKKISDAQKKRYENQKRERKLLNLKNS